MLLGRACMCGSGNTRPEAGKNAVEPPRSSHTARLFAVAAGRPGGPTASVDMRKLRRHNHGWHMRWRGGI